MPPINDNLANATLIDTTVSLAGTTVDSTAEVGQETDDGYVNTVWYRIEPTGDTDMTFGINGASFAYYAELYEYPGGGTPTDFADLVNGYANFVEFLGDGTTANSSKIVTLNSTSAYYIVVLNYAFTEGIVGTFNLSIFMPRICIYNAEDWITGSGTVSLTGGSPQWVRDTQYRSYTADVEWKGNLDYTASLEITIDCPAGNYSVDLYRQFGNAGVGEDGVYVHMRVNGKPKGGYYDIGYGPPGSGGITPDATPGWEPLTAELDNVGPYEAGGPRYLKLKPGDILRIDYGSAGITASRWMEVQKIRLTESISNFPLPAWQIPTEDIETWEANDLWTLHMVKSFEDTLYLFADQFTGTGGAPALNVWTWQLVNDDLIPISGDLGLDPDGGTVRDIRYGTPGVIEVVAKDFTIMPNGDLYACWAEQTGNYPYTNTCRLILAHYDASGDSWTILNNDCRGTGDDSKTIWYVSVDNDGENVFFAWGQDRQGSGLPRGTWWRCMKYDIGGATLTELGSGQTAYPGAAATTTEDGNLDYALRLKCSPAGVPWVVWPAYDPDATVKNEHAFAWYWDGSSWQDSGVPDPSLVPPDIGLNTYAVAGDITDPAQYNYIAFAVYGLFYVDLTFCQHDGPNENPSILFQYVWNSQTGGIIDTSTWAYFEYNGTSWDNELRIIEGVDIYSTEPNAFGQCRDGDPNIAVAGGWTQGFSLDNDGKVPYVFSQKGWKLSNIDHVYAARIKANGTGMEEIGQGFPDCETLPSYNFGGWVDLTTNGGCIVNGKPVCVWADEIAWAIGIVMAIATGGAIDLTRIKFRGFQRGDAED